MWIVMNINRPNTYWTGRTWSQVASEAAIFERRRQAFDAFDRVWKTLAHRDRSCIRFQEIEQ